MQEGREKREEERILRPMYSTYKECREKEIWNIGKEKEREKERERAERE